MSERYLPEADFLNSLRDGDVPLPGDELEEAETSPLFAELCEANLQVLIRFMRDDDRSNRDWATFMLALRDFDTPAVRDALVRASRDADDIVRDEAIWGLARRDTSLALPLVLKVLDSNVSVPLLGAAELCADLSLVAALRAWREEIDVSESFFSYLADALAACEGSTPSA